MTEREINHKREISEIETFPIPFPLKEIKDNIFISSNSFSKPSKELIIKQALHFHSQGNIQEAAKQYKYFIDQGFKDHKVFSNYGVILKNLGKLQDAELLYRKAIKIKPDYAEAHSNLGNVLKDLRKLKEAELFLRKSIELKPYSFQDHLHLAEVLYDLRKKEEAKICEWKAIEISTSSQYLKSYRENAKLVNKTAFFILGLNTFNHFKPIIDINPDLFEIIVQDNVDNETILKIRNELNNKEIAIRYINEIIKNKLIYKNLVSVRSDMWSEIIEYKNNIPQKSRLPSIKLLGKNNIRLMYTAGKNKYTINSYWNKYYDGILCYGTYHETKFKAKHNIATAQMGYPRFDKYFKPGFDRDYLLEKFKCDPKKKTIVWLTTWSDLSSVENYIKEFSLLRSGNNIVVRPHPTMKYNDPDNHKKLFTVDFNYIDNTTDDNVQLYALADLMIFDYGGPMFGALYLNKNFAFLDMELKSKNNSYLGESSSEDYLKSFFPDRIAKSGNLKSICDYCLNNPPSDSLVSSLRNKFFNTNYKGKSAERAYNLINSNDWIKK